MQLRHFAAILAVVIVLATTLLLTGPDNSGQVASDVVQTNAGSSLATDDSTTDEPNTPADGSTDSSSTDETPDASAGAAKDGASQDSTPASSEDSPKSSDAVAGPGNTEPELSVTDRNEADAPTEPNASLSSDRSQVTATTAEPSATAAQVTTSTVAQTTNDAPTTSTARVTTSAPVTTTTAAPTTTKAPTTTTAAPVTTTTAAPTTTKAPTTTTAAPVTTTTAPTINGPISEAQFEAIASTEVFRLTNCARTGNYNTWCQPGDEAGWNVTQAERTNAAGNKISPLNSVASINNSASAWSATMASTGNFQHSTFGAENIAFFGNGSTSTTTLTQTKALETASTLMGQWMNSESHRVNLLRDQYRGLGTGVALKLSSEGGLNWFRAYGTQQFN